MGWGREGRESSAQGSQSPSDSPVKQPHRQMTTGKIFPNYLPEWLNDDNSDCPLLRPVLQAMIAPSNITIPQLTVTGNPFSHLIKKGPSATPQKAPALKPIPSSPGGTPLSLGKYAVEPPSPGTESLDQVDHDSDRKSPFTPPTQAPTLTLTIPPRQSTPDRPMPSFQAFLEARQQQREQQQRELSANTPAAKETAFLTARQQQRELSAGTPAVKETASKTRIYLAGLSTDYQDHLINIQQLRTYAKTYRQSWHYVVGLYIQSFRDPSAFQVAPHCWEKDAWKADMLEKNPGSFLIWPDPARGSIEHEIMEQLRGSELKRQAMEAAIVDWSHSCQPQEVINVMSKAGWTRRSEYVFGTNWSVMDTIKRMDEGPEKMSLLAKAKRESPLFFKKCMEDEMCGIKRKLSASLPTGRHCYRYHPTSKRKLQDEGKGPFGSGRLRRKRFTRQPEPPTVSGIEEVLMREKIQQEKKHARWRKCIAAKDGTYSHPQPKHMKPTQVILHGYSPNNRDNAVAAYESISKGMICEDYHRDPKICRYPGVANPPRKRPLTPQERLLSRYQSGNCWIRVTFDTIKAAQEAVRQSPHRIGNHLVFAHMYDGFGPQEDMPIPWQDNCTSPNQDCGCS